MQSKNALLKRMHRIYQQIRVINLFILSVTFKNVLRVYI